MILRDALFGINYEVIQGSLDKNIKSITDKSDKVKKDFLFVCIKGNSFDGHLFINDVVNKGASTVIVEQYVNIARDDVTIIKVKNTKDILPVLASNFYESPSYNLNLIGVTGTNGKTTTAHVISEILNYYGKKTGLLGTVENIIGDKVLSSSLTTPQPIELQGLLAEMVKEHINYGIMEVSSHALDLHRVDKCHFKLGIFTNLTLDHLDYHKTMQNYFLAKSKLFRMCSIGIINIDDPYATNLIKESTCKVYTYGVEKQADFRAKNIKISPKGVKYTLDYDNNSEEIVFNITGKFSVYNSLAAILSCYLLGVPMKIIKEALKKGKGVKGRFQSLESRKGYYVIVDYAHTPDALVNVLKTIKEYTQGKIITVFGCGGDRDNSKRYVMGEVSGKYSDYCIITSDNPRTEEPLSIIEEIEPGMIKSTCPYEKIVNRKEAILKALSLANQKDIILIAGKGHEDYQIIGTKKIHFDDVEIVKQYMEEEND